MMTKEEVAQVIAYCDENKISYKQRLAELGVNPWSLYDAKRKYAPKEDGENAGEFLQLVPGGSYLGSTLLWGNNMAPSTTDPQKVMDLLAWDISERCQFALGSGKQFTFRTILMTDPVRLITKRYFLSERHTTKSSGHFCPRRRSSLCMTLKKNSMPGGEVSIRRYSPVTNANTSASYLPAPRL